MWSWRWLQPAYIDRLYNAGEIVDMPADFVPPAACEPLDAEAAAAYFAAGPQVCGLIRQQYLWLTTAPATYWRPTNAEKTIWELTGLGRGLGAVKWTSNAERGAVP
jgi:hypothetical protein